MGRAKRNPSYKTRRALEPDEIRLSCVHEGAALPLPLAGEAQAVYGRRP
jgi:hypothetical protein